MPTNQRAWAQNDISITPTGSWTTPVTPHIRERQPDDADFVASIDNPQGAQFVVQLNTLNAPVGDPPGTNFPGPHRIKVRLRKVGPDDLPVFVKLLRDDNRIVAQRTLTAGAAFNTQVLELTLAEIARINGYANLKLLVQADFARVTTCPSANPMALSPT